MGNSNNSGITSTKSVDSPMIPKIIHYCWYGSKEIPRKYSKCIETWGRYLPDYEIIKWDESNTPIDTEFLKYCHHQKLWAFMSDYIRMRAIYTHGGIYLDSDFEVIRSLNPLLDEKCFIGHEAQDRPTTGIIGATPNHEFPKQCMSIIDHRHERGLPYLIAPEVAAQALATTAPSRITIFPQNYFYPYNPYDPARKGASLMFSDITSDTYAIHHWAKGWSEENLKNNPIRKILKKTLFAFKSL